MLIVKAESRQWQNISRVLPGPSEARSAGGSRVCSFSPLWVWSFPASAFPMLPEIIPGKQELLSPLREWNLACILLVVYTFTQPHVWANCSHHLCLRKRLEEGLVCFSQLCSPHGFFVFAIQCRVGGWSSTTEWQPQRFPALHWDRTTLRCPGCLELLQTSFLCPREAGITDPLDQLLIRTSEKSLVLWKKFNK